MAFNMFLKKVGRKEENIIPLSLGMTISTMTVLYNDDQILSLTAEVALHFWCQSATEYSRQQLQYLVKRLQHSTHS